MSVVTTEPAVETSAEAEERFTAIYEQNFGKLASIAVRKFRVPESEAETLAHEVFLTYLRRSEEIRDLHSWLVGAICHASRYYWRMRDRNLEPAQTETTLERMDPASTRILDSLPDQI